MSNVSVLILTYNEEKHIARCIHSLLPVSKDIYVVDSYSTDRTVEICESLGAKVYQNTWKNYASQFQWGLEKCSINTTWVMRMDADEYITQDLQNELGIVLECAEDRTAGFYIRRKYKFLGKWIKHGGVYPLNLLRVWKHGKGRIETRWMDEHIVLDDGVGTEQLNGHIVDDNLNNTRWWTDKHNKYADREMIDILNRKYAFFELDENLMNDNSNKQAKIKRMFKERVYNKLPLFVRPLLYFLYRYFVQLGFLDGTRGFAFHFMQGYWYRCMIDLRVYEAEIMLKDANDNQERIRKLRELTGLDL